MTKDSDPLGEIFEHADMGKKGFLDKEDVNALIRAMGYEVRDEYVDGVLQLYGEDTDGRSGIHFDPNFKLWEHLGGKPTDLCRPLAVPTATAEGQVTSMAKSWKRGSCPPAGRQLCLTRLEVTTSTSVRSRSSLSQRRRRMKTAIYLPGGNG